MTTSWVPLLGQFNIEAERITFLGAPPRSEAGQTLHAVGNILSSQQFGGGVLSATFTFSSVSQDGAGLILFYQTTTRAFIAVTLGAGALCSIRSWANNQWVTHSIIGSPEHFKVGEHYDLKVTAKGSHVVASLNGVDVLSANLPFPLPKGQCGVWATGIASISITDFAVHRERPRAFVVMQYSSPFNELYDDVISKVCDSLGLLAQRADDTFGPGLIIADIERQILEAKVVIADITPSNPNVYYEVGFSHAMKKPTILVAEGPMKLPFDVSPFRTLFYENTIAGKAKIEAGLRKHLEAIQTDWAV